MSARRVVVADNDPEALDLVCIDLDLEGHDIVGRATDGETAVELCRELNPDVLVVDYRMPPGPNGAEVARRVRKELPAVTVVVFTNYDNADVARAVRRAGAHLVRKGELNDLRRAVAD
ncbi:MAG TPA: response regulator transcription factor [Acidimicrobiia bacterium]|nr:response regulator transcription factor [Acidimicrobiia bacterium]